MTDHKPTARERLVRFLELFEPVADSIGRGRALVTSLEARGIDPEEILRALVALDDGLYVDVGFSDAMPVIDRIGVVGLRLARRHHDIGRMRMRTRKGKKPSPEQVRLSARLARVLVALEGWSAGLQQSGDPGVDPHP